MTRMDFRRVKDAANFDRILRHYGLKAFGAGAQRMVLCPFHEDTKPSCSIHLERKAFNCFGCGAHGSVLDFVAQIEVVSIRDAAERVEEICDLASDSPLARTARIRPNLTEKRYDRGSSDRALRPLPFRLTLDPSHPYLAERGIDQELAATFEVGYCRHGTMKGRICIPIHNQHGALVAYAGRWASDEIPPDVPKYQLPRGFEKRRVLFGLHRLASAEHVVLFEGYWSVFRLYALGIPAVAIMGRTISPEQQALLIDSGVRMLSLLLDGDGPGQAAADQLLPRLAERFFVRVVSLPHGAAPDTVSEQFLIEVLCNRR
jgi:DNA primase